MIIMWLISIVLVCFVGFLTLLYRKRCQEHNVFRKMGLSGPDPNWLFGNFTEFIKTPMFKTYQKWTKKYGKTFGYYEGPTPVIVTSDLDFIKNVFVKQFSCFHGRREFFIQHEPDSPIMIHMLMARGERWKRLRTISNPTFSTSKMKQMVSFMNSSTDVFLGEIEKKRQEGKPVNIYNLFQGLTLDVFAKCGFGLEVNSQTDPNDPFLKNCRWLFNTTSSPMILYFIAALFPEVRPFWQQMWYVVKKFTGNPYVWLGDTLAEVVKMRRNMKEDNKVDLMRLLIDAEDSTALASDHQLSAMALDDNADEELQNAVQPSNNLSNRTKKGLTNEEIKMQSELFLVAAYETTSTTLGYIAHLLSQNPECQKRLQEEIDEYIEGGEVSYEKVNAMPYLEMVICETLRMYPVASLIMGRKCLESCHINGYDIPSGVTVMADVWTLHYDPDIWGPNSEKFDPERFTAANKSSRHPLAWVPFGAGPRNCIGLRFAMLEIKLALAALLQTYTLVSCDKTQVPLELKEGATITPKDGVIVNVELRK